MKKLKIISIVGMIFLAIVAIIWVSKPRLISKNIKTVTAE